MSEINPQWDEESRKRLNTAYREVYKRKGPLLHEHETSHGSAVVRALSNTLEELHQTRLERDAAREELRRIGYFECHKGDEAGAYYAVTLAARRFLSKPDPRVEAIRAKLAEHGQTLPDNVIADLAKVGV